MGIGFVFFIYLVLLGMLMVPGIPICAGIGYFLARGRSKRLIKTFVIIGGLLPIIGAAYITGCIVFMAIIGLATGRDVGFGDGFDLPLNNHYHWSAIDTTDTAKVYDLRDRRATDGDGDIHIDAENREAFSNVLEFQEDGDWIAGAYSSYDNRIDNPAGKIVADKWFLFNTRTHQRIDAKSEDDLGSLAARLGVHLNLQPSNAFYSTHRLRWSDGLILTILCGLPFIGLFFLWKKARAALTASSTPL